MSAHASVDLSRAMSQSSQSRRSSQALQNDLMLRHSISSGRYQNPDIFSDDYSLDQSGSGNPYARRDPSLSSVNSSLTACSSQPGHDTTNNRLGVRDSVENPFGDAARVSFDETILQQQQQHQRSSNPYKTNRDSLASSVNTTPSVTQRSQSSSSRTSIPPRALSPYRGATGPSHPYGMYPQVGVTRTPSVTTTSSVRVPERPVPESSAPQHPYGLYPQNVVVEEGIDNPFIPVGFPGHLQTYQQTTRTDDEIADIVGPDGHTEPLPPYSRFPDGIVPNSDESDNANIIIEEDHPNGYVGPPASGTSSRSLVDDTNSRTRAVPSDGAAGTNNNQPIINEKANRRGARRVCCGLPVWTIVLIAAVMVICAVIGGVIGGVLGANGASGGGSKKPKGAPQQGNNPTTAAVVTVTATPGLDATPVPATPTNLSSPPNGQFEIAPTAHNLSRFCISDQDFKTSWACLEDTSILFNVGGSGNHRTATFGNQSVPNFFTYGAQPPIFHSPTKNLKTMLDTNDVSFGPALFFYDIVDKLVIVHENAFVRDPSSSAKEAVSDTGASPESIANVGDKPWFCWWNSTILEFFMYIDEEISPDSQDNSSATASASGTSSSNPDSMPQYPRRIKMEEKRNYPNAKTPYCQQMQVLGGGSVAPLASNTFEIKEIEPAPSSTMVSNSDSTDSSARVATTNYGSQCFCESMSG